MKTGEKHLNNHPVTTYGPYNLVQFDFLVFAIHVESHYNYPKKSLFSGKNKLELKFFFLKKSVPQLCSF